MDDNPTATLVGELNPLHSDPDFALYPSPDGCSGHRLCCAILGMLRRDYLRAFARVNLCAGKWSMPRARERASKLRGRRLVLLGKKVSAAFGMDFVPFSSAVEERGDVVTRMLVLPHPSGINRMWNYPEAAVRCRKAVMEFLPNAACLIGKQLLVVED